MPGVPCKQPVFCPPTGIGQIPAHRLAGQGGLGQRAPCAAQVRINEGHSGPSETAEKGIGPMTILSDIHVAAQNHRLIGRHMLRNELGHQVDLPRKGAMGSADRHTGGLAGVEMRVDDADRPVEAGHLEMRDQHAFVRQTVEPGAGEIGEGHAIDLGDGIVGQNLQAATQLLADRFTTIPPRLRQVGLIRPIRCRVGPVRRVRSLRDMDIACAGRDLRRFRRERFLQQDDMGLLARPSQCGEPVGDTIQRRAAIQCDRPG